MIKRSLNERFGAKVLAGVKRTTMRQQPWKLGEVMLYHWAGKAYRSKHVDVCVVEVKWCVPVTMTIDAAGVGLEGWDLVEKVVSPLWEVEGFDSEEDMVRWFREKYKPGVYEMWLMGFEVVEGRKV